MDLKSSTHCAPVEAKNFPGVNQYLGERKGETRRSCAANWSAPGGWVFGCGTKDQAGGRGAGGYALLPGGAA